MSSYTPTIGLEIHAELKTKTKMFCDSPNAPEISAPNENICPVCMGHPGTLPVINKEAVKQVLKIGAALSGTLADFTEFDRKNYFYPDLPKGYQISQYVYPLVRDAKLEDISIERIHLEEDTARSQHTGEGATLIDYNRAGVPLMELVTKPVITDAEQAGRFARELQLLLRTLGASNANMELGQMRVEANVSVSSSDTLGTKVEVKNLNSFRAVERAIAHEIERQTAALERGEAISQETRGWDDDAGKTKPQRLKEESEDYRYFPDPDLPKLKISEFPEFSKEALEGELPELPWDKRMRLQNEYNLSEQAVEMFVRDTALSDFLASVRAELSDSTEALKRAVNYITSDIVGFLKENSDVPWQNTLSASAFAELMRMAANNEVSSRGAKDILAKLLTTGGDPRAIAQAEGLFQTSDTGELKETIQQIIKENPAEVVRFKNGEEKLLQFFVGQGMKATKGAANPEKLAELFKEELAH